MNVLYSNITRSIIELRPINREKLPISLIINYTSISEQTYIEPLSISKDREIIAELNSFKMKVTTLKRFGESCIIWKIPR